MKEIMIDIETLDVKTSAVILSIGLVKFDQEGTDEGITLYPCLYEQLHNRTMGQATLDWWQQQTRDAREDAFNPANREIPLGISERMKYYCEGVEKFWCNGPHFDIAILESYLSAPYPWRYNQILDMRTMRKECEPTESSMEPSMEHVAHRAIDDCKYQIMVLRACRAKLNCLRSGQFVEVNVV